jgi:mannosyltransferase
MTPLRFNANQLRWVVTLVYHGVTGLFWRLRRPPRRVALIIKAFAPAALIMFIEVLIHVQTSRIPRPTHDLDTPFVTQCQDPVAAAKQPRESATFVMLARNSEINEARQAIESIERKFNQWFNYPVMFLNDEEWSPEFIRVLNETVSGKASFEVISKEDWTFPSWMNVQDARASIASQGERGIYNGGKESYHHMCRFNSG